MNRKITPTLSLVAIAGVLLVVLEVDLPDNVRLWQEIQNFGHVLLFGILSLAALILSQHLLGTRISKQSFHYLVALTAAIVAGGGTELIQRWTGGDGDVFDLVMDILGAASFLGFYATYDPGVTSGRRTIEALAKRFVRACALMLAGGAFLPPALWGVAYYQRQRIFPRVCSFESYWENKFLVTQDADLVITSPSAGWTNEGGGHVGKLTLKVAPYPGIAVQEPYPDWTSYGAFCFDIYSEMSDSIVMDLRIDDRHHNFHPDDRFVERLTVSPGINHFRIPLTRIRSAPAKRQMDMAGIAAIMFFASHPAQPFTIYIDNIRLE